MRTIHRKPTLRGVGSEHPPIDVVEEVAPESAPPSRGVTCRPGTSPSHYPSRYVLVAPRRETLKLPLPPVGDQGPRRRQTVLMATAPDAPPSSTRNL